MSIDALPFGPPPPRPKRYQKLIDKLSQARDEEIATAVEGFKKWKDILRLIHESPPELQRRVFAHTNPELLLTVLKFLRPGEVFRLMDSNPPFVMPLKFLDRSEQLAVWMKHGFPNSAKIPRHRQQREDLKKLARKWFYWVTLLEPWLAERFLRAIPPRYFAIAFDQRHQIHSHESIKRRLIEYYLTAPPKPL